MFETEDVYTFRQMQTSRDGWGEGSRVGWVGSRVGSADGWGLKIKRLLGYMLILKIRKQ